jgi:nucleotide-binding universal stress UspA family protein
MYRRIVVPLDGSSLAEESLPQAEELARLTGAPIHLIWVVDCTRLERYGPYALALEYSATEPMLAEEIAIARTYLQGVEECLVATGLTVDSEVIQGRVARELVAAAKPGDLMVMASHGRGGLSRWLLGSVAEDVLRHTMVPVLLVKAGMATGGNVSTEPEKATTGNERRGRKR